MCSLCTPSGIHDCQQRIRGTVREEELPMCVRDVLDVARAVRPDSDVMCIAFHTLESGREIARIGPGAELIGDRSAGSFAACLRPKDLLVLSVTVTETTFETVHTVTHVLITWTRRRIRSTSGAYET